MTEPPVPPEEPPVEEPPVEEPPVPEQETPPPPAAPPEPLDPDSPVKPNMTEQQIRDAGLAIDVPYETGAGASGPMEYADDAGEEWKPEPDWRDKLVPADYEPEAEDVFATPEEPTPEEQPPPEEQPTE